MKCELCKKDYAMFRKVYEDGLYLWLCRKCKDIEEAFQKEVSHG